MQQKARRLPLCGGHRAWFKPLAHAALQLGLAQQCLHLALEREVALGEQQVLVVLAARKSAFTVARTSV